MAAKPRAQKSRANNARRTTSKQRRGQHVLDVAVRSQQAVRQRQAAMFGAVCKILLLVALAVGIYFGVSRAVAMLLLKNPEYNIADLQVQTDGSLSPDAVLAAADLHKGTNIFLVSLGRAQARVEAIPQVEKAQITRQLPSRINIQIYERKPAAWIAPEHGAATRQDVTASNQSFLIDAHGLLWQPRKLLPPDYFLPIIRSYNGGPRSDGEECAGEEVRAALELLRAEQDSPLAARFQIEEIDLSKHFGIVVTDRNGLQVLFGLDDMDKQLKRLEVYLQPLDQGTEKPHTINLLAERNVPVTFYPSPTPAGGAPAASPAPSPSPSPGKDKDKAGEKTKAGDSKNHKAHPSPSPRLKPDQ
jgi:cell division septal protein FtsQ